MTTNPGACPTCGTLNTYDTARRTYQCPPLSCGLATRSYRADTIAPTETAAEYAARTASDDTLADYVDDRAASLGWRLAARAEQERRAARYRLTYTGRRALAAR